MNAAQVSLQATRTAWVGVNGWFPGVGDILDRLI